MGNTRFKGANSGEKLIQSTVLDDDQLQVRHAVGTINDVDKGLSKAIVQSTNIAVCSTASATTAKTATIQNFPDFTLLPGREVLVYFANKNTAENPTLNINNTGAFPISLESLAYTSRSEKDLWAAGSFVRVKYVDITVSGTRIQCWVMTPSQNALNGALTNVVINNNLYTINGIKYQKVPLREKNYYGIASDGLLFNCINDNSGIVFDFPYNCEYLYIETTKNISVQFGFCTENATLPTIMSAGTGRNSYKNINTVGNHYFKNSGLNNTCYVAGATNAQITKVFALVRYE